jgi:hypothetical protein
VYDVALRGLSKNTDLKSSNNVPTGNTPQWALQRCNGTSKRVSRIIMSPCN